ncbi:MAG: hypothetical protein LBI72_09205 [Flavobacteriaceae bacterium]|jgi:hypothetical protein|nr:hypothetical protein [Flavobacteriaceae bacterium]
MVELEFSKKIDVMTPILSAVVIDEDTAIFLSYREDNMHYQLVYVKEEKVEILPLDYTEKYYSIADIPILFASNKQFGIIKNKSELFVYSIEKEIFECIAIEQVNTLPQRFRLQGNVPISNCSNLPICFSGDSLGNDTRYIAYLVFDWENKKAYWEGWNSISTDLLLHHTDKQYPPKIDAVMCKDDELYIFTSGGQITSVNKWGMDYYALIKSNKAGIITQILLDSGDLHTIDHKKRGVNGLFTTSQEYLVLTPVFKNDEWKGKQRLFSMVTQELLTISFPRGLGKQPQVIEHIGDCFWIYLKESNEIVICKEKTNSIDS